MAIPEEPAPGVPEWVVTFGDMMSLLLTFFIMLVSMSEIKEDRKYQAMVESFREMFGHEMSSATLIPGDIRPRNSTQQEHVMMMGRAKRKDTHNGGADVKAVVGENDRVQIVRPGDDATAGGVVYFDGNAAEITDEVRKGLDVIIDQISGKPQKLELRGHTTSAPVNPAAGYRDHYDLAFARSRAVRDYFVKQGIESARIRLTAAGATEPIYNGVDPDQLKRNARVQVLMWDERIEDFDALPSSGAGSAP
ncbi:MAG: OmpA family protein [Pirellulales bacterium]|nr:OmpA family protein [Pirellulales bacterium]MBX3434204.1 OmpA family protein [Pirellulales bacterium]